MMRIVKALVIAAALSIPAVAFAAAAESPSSDCCCPLCCGGK